MRRKRRVAPLVRLRFQPPVHSPLAIRWILRAAATPAGPAGDPRPRLLSYLLDAYTAHSGVLCGSGTDALRRALELAGAWTDGAPAALPAFACFDVATAAVGAGARVAFYDVDPATLAPDLASLDAALRAGARSVVAAPLYGVPVDWAELRALADRHGAILIEDAAQGHGAAWHGAPLGSLGDLSVLSFGRGKGWTGVRGGALLVRGNIGTGHRIEWPNVEIAAAGVPVVSRRVAAPVELQIPTPRRAAPADEARVLLAAFAQCTLARPSLYGLPRAIPGLHLGETRYREPAPPRPMARAAAALVELSRTHADAEADARRRNARRLLERIRPGDHLATVRPPEGSVPGYLRLPLRLTHGFGGLDDPAAAARLGIAPSYPTPLTELPPLRPLWARPPAPCPGARTLSRQLVTLPTHSRLTAAEHHEVLRAVHARRP